MATLRKVARASKLAKMVELTNNVLNKSVMVGFKGIVIDTDINKLNQLLHDHCMVGVVALERGDINNRLHV